MKKNIFLAIFFVAFLSFVVIACKMDAEENNPFKGTWVSSEGYTTIWDNSSWHVVHYMGGVGLKGTYTYKDSTATVVYTEITNDGVNWRAISFSEISNYTNTATISGNKLTWGLTIYTKR